MTMPDHTPGFCRLLAWDARTRMASVGVGCETEDGPCQWVGVIGAKDEATAVEWVRRWNEIERQLHNVTE